MNLSTNISPRMVMPGMRVWYMYQRCRPGHLIGGTVVAREGKKLVAIFPDWSDKTSSSSPFDDCARKVFTFRERKSGQVWLEHNDSHPNPTMSSLWFPDQELLRHMDTVMTVIKWSPKKEEICHKLTPKYVMEHWDKVSPAWRKEIFGK